MEWITPGISRSGKAARSRLGITPNRKIALGQLPPPAESPAHDSVASLGPYKHGPLNYANDVIYGWSELRRTPALSWVDNSHMATPKRRVQYINRTVSHIARSIRIGARR